MRSSIPEPFTNWTASIAEDVVVIGGLWAALHHPVVFLIGLAGFVALMIWLLPRIWRGLKAVAAWVRRKLGRAPGAGAGGDPPPLEQIL